jgi:Tol biopolymer transport system component
VSASAPADYRWSPDGRSISVADDSPRLAVIDAGSGAATDLGPSLASIGAHDLWEARWAPDGRSIGFVYSSGVGNMVGIVTIASATARTIGEYGDVTNVLEWSPDGRSLAVVRGIKGGYLVLLGADGLTDEALLDKAEIDQLAPFGWSPDGTWLACTFLDGELGTLSADGLEVKPVFVPPAGTSVQFVGWARG